MNRRTASLRTGRGAASELAEAVDRGLVTGPESALVARLVAARPILEQTTELPEQTRQAQRARLVAVATVRSPTTVAAAGTGRPAALPAATGPRRRTVVTLASATGLLGLGGVLAAASLSLPGDPFYDVKRGQESVALALSFGEQARGGQHLEMATTRLQEVRGLVEGRDALDASSSQPEGSGATTPGRLDRVAKTLVAMDVSTRSGTALLTDLWRQGDDAVPLRTLERWAQSQSSQLNTLLPRLDSPGRNQAAVSLALLQDVDDWAAELMSTRPCPGGCEPRSGLPQTPSDPVRPTDVRPTGNPGIAPIPRSGPALPTPTSSPTPPSPGPTSAPVTPSSSASPPARPDVGPPTDPAVPSVVPDLPVLPDGPLPSVPPPPVPPVPPVPLPDAPLPDVPLPDVTLPDVPLPDVPLPDVPLPDGTIIPPPSLPETDSILLPSVTLVTGTPRLPGAG